MNNFTIIKSFIQRLESIGVDVTTTGNYPWVYLDTVNGVRVTERYLGEHGFTAFWFPVRLTDKTKFTDRRKVFNKVRTMIECSK